MIEAWSFKYKFSSNYLFFNKVKLFFRVWLIRWDSYPCESLISPNPTNTLALCVRWPNMTIGEETAKVFHCVRSHVATSESAVEQSHVAWGKTLRDGSRFKLYTNNLGVFNNGGVYKTYKMAEHFEYACVFKSTFTSKRIQEVFS